MIFSIFCEQCGAEFRWNTRRGGSRRYCEQCQRERHTRQQRVYDTRLRSGPRKRARLEFYRAHIAELTTEFSIASIAEQAGITKQKSWGILRRLAEDGLIVTTKRGGRNRTFKRGDIA